LSGKVSAALPKISFTLKPGRLLLFSSAKKVSKNAVADKKIAKNQFNALKSRNSSL